MAEAEETTEPAEKTSVAEEDEEDVGDCKKLHPLDQVLKADARQGENQPSSPDCTNYMRKDDGPPPPPPPTSRDFRIYKAMNTKEWGQVCECHGTKDQAILDLLAITITTVMLLAAKESDIKQPQLRWAADCLENVRDDNGQVPPNIRGILNIMKSKITGDPE